MGAVCKIVSIRRVGRVNESCEFDATSHCSSAPTAVACSRTAESTNAEFC